jgi:hypothetical protein
MSKQRVAEYMVVTVCNKQEFESLVNRQLKNGWQPLGGVAVSSYDTGWVQSYSQAMAKYEDSAKTEGQ